MDDFLQRFIGDTLARIDGFRRGGKSEDVSAFAQSLERTALFLGKTGLVSAAQSLRGAIARLGGRGETDHAAVAADVRAELDDVAQALRALAGRRQGLPAPTAEAGTSRPAPAARAVAGEVARIRRLAIDAIRVGERLRRLDPAKLEMLESSMRDIGLRTPITVAVDDTGGWRLVAGLHRLEAARRLGLTEIDGFVLDRSEPAARLWEIDENLVRAELTQLERDQHLLRRKQIFEAWVAGETGRIAPGLGGRGHKGFATDTEEKTGIAKRRVNESVRRASRIAAEIQDAVRAMPAADVRVELDALASLEHGEQKLAVDKVQRGEAANFRAARRQIRGDAETGETDRQVKALQSAWRNAGAEARTRFVRWLRDSGEAKVLGLPRRTDDPAPDRPCRDGRTKARVTATAQRRLRITDVGGGRDVATRGAN